MFLLYFIIYTCLETWPRDRQSYLLTTHVYHGQWAMKRLQIRLYLWSILSYFLLSVILTLHIDSPRLMITDCRILKWFQKNTRHLLQLFIPPTLPLGVQIALGGVADTNGRVAVGDRLVRVNSLSLVNVTHAEAVDVLQNAGDFALLVLVKGSSSQQQYSFHEPPGMSNVEWTWKMHFTKQNAKHIGHESLPRWDKV